MSSMFRSPEEFTPSDPESSSDDETLEEVSKKIEIEVNQELNAGVPQHTAVLTSGSTAQAHLFYGALLEDWCYKEVIEALGGQDASGRRLTRDSPEVQALGSDLYSSLSAQLGTHGVIGQGYQGSEWQMDRKIYRDGLKVLLNRALHQRLASGRTPSTALSPLATPYQPGVPYSFASRPNSPKLLSGASITTKNIPSIQERLDAMQLRSNPHTMIGSPPTLFPSIVSTGEPQFLQPSRYATDFAELELIGRGGYGKVFRVVNHLDGQEYAIKKITLSPKRLRRLQDGGSNELEALLREIRTLAALHHSNIVRYFGGWIEQTDARIAKDPPRLATQAMAMLHDRPARSDEDFSLGLQFDDEQDRDGPTLDEDNILFGYSSNSAEKFENDLKDRQRRASQATTSSDVTMKSFVQSREEYEDDDIESIPRPFGFPTQGQTSTDDQSSQNLFSDGGRPHTPRERADSGESNEPTWTLHIQMSLYPLSLASYLSLNDQTSSQCAKLIDRHCFHLLPTLRLILAILSGVEYLHIQNVVHRDLKPANIFLSIHKGTAYSTGCVDISMCPQCEPTDKAPAYVIPRIGDFGLVADISPPEAPTSQCNGSPIVSLNEIAEPLAGSYKGAATQPLSPLKDRAIGTEFYRPPSKAVSPDEKLDVFSLGVIAFELLWKFETRMERHAVLANLNKCLLPLDFSEKVGENSGRLEECLRGMLSADAAKRFSCKIVRECMEKLHEDVAKATPSTQ
ncbi:MAG: hypothetical protein M1830_006622 [Pleopsidium flavum]|nr:MAG: hypothetical protein M1830_006622 [Pleopsidium flavum]